jgi:UDP-2,4-diacetamido-2,4,6-trideoxy-beta-L-altropyranose hydrolase
MLIVFRADATAEIGGGHVMRCLALAREMQRRGADVAFASVAGTIAIVPALARFGIPCFDPNQEDWSNRAARYFGLKQVDIITVDSYSLGYEFERALRHQLCPIAVINDAPTMRHDCDLLVDMTLKRTASEYAGLVPDNCRILAGSFYALIRDEFAALRSVSLTRRRALPELKAVFISLGMTDIGGQTIAVARALLNDNLIERIDVIVGRATAPYDNLFELEGRESRLRVHVDPPDIAHLMANADIAIGTPGTSSWERCCLGLPSILFVVAPNQTENARILEEAGAALVLRADHNMTSVIARIIRDYRASPTKLAEMSRQAADICDGTGCYAVGQAIDDLIRPDKPVSLTLREASIDDSRRLWDWRNESIARAMSGNQVPVPWQTHVAWVALQLSNPKTRIFIVEALGKPCGTVRFQLELTRTASVSITMAADARGKGYGAAALALACKEAFRRRFCDSIEARIKSDNVASQKVFIKNGFMFAANDEQFEIYRLNAINRSF